MRLAAESSQILRSLEEKVRTGGGEGWGGEESRAEWQAVRGRGPGTVRLGSSGKTQSKVT